MSLNRPTGGPPRIDPEQLAASLRGVHESLNDDDLLPSLLRALSACDMLFRLSGCGLLVEDAESGLQYVAATDGHSRSLEIAQVEVNEGPCVDAFVTDTVVQTEDLIQDGRWPRLSKAMEQTPVHAVLGTPVHFDGIAVGSLDVYLAGTHQWDESEREAVARYADIVGSILENGVKAHRASDIAQQLRQALESRVEIERAVGYLMGKLELSAPDAFEMLRGSARSQRRKVRDLSREILMTGTLPR